MWSEEGDLPYVQRKRRGKRISGDVELPLTPGRGSSKGVFKSGTEIEKRIANLS